jgi:uncharacterized protein YqeY
MSDCAIKQKIQADMKDAMRAQDKQRLGAIRLALAALKQKEVDERVTLTDADVLGILDKMIKQRRDSIAQYQTANREDLIAQEQAEIEVLKTYLPQALSDAEINQIIQQAISDAGAKDAKDLGKVIGLVKPQVQGRADMSVVSQRIKQALS